VASADHYREFCRRQHRSLAAFLALKCWTEGADFVVITRDFLQSYLDLERFKSQRKDWLKADFEHLFPHQKDLIFRGTQGKFASIYFFRAPFDDDLFEGTMSDEERIASAKKKHGIKGYLVDNDNKINETKIMTQLALLASGLPSSKI
jgi:hypothetical protein